MICHTKTPTGNRKGTVLSYMMFCRSTRDSGAGFLSGCVQCAKIHCSDTVEFYLYLIIIVQPLTN
jgi:hypothetical protein